MLTDAEGYTADDTWRLQGRAYKIEMLRRAGLSIFAARRSVRPDCERLETLLCGH
jgi:hypothetical protein